MLNFFLTHKTVESLFFSIFLFSLVNCKRNVCLCFFFERINGSNIYIDFLNQYLVFLLSGE